MSRSGYSDDYDDVWQAVQWRSAVRSASNGKRGQQFFRDLLAALDAMPVKRLIAYELEEPSGSVCAIGALGKARGVPMQDIDPEDYVYVASAFNIAEALARETVFMNDEWGRSEETPEQRFVRMRAWVASQIKPEVVA